MGCCGGQPSGSRKFPLDNFDGTIIGSTEGMRVLTLLYPFFFFFCVCANVHNNWTLVAVSHFEPLEIYI